MLTDFGMSPPALILQAGKKSKFPLPQQEDKYLENSGKRVKAMQRKWPSQSGNKEFEVF